VPDTGDMLEHGDRIRRLTSSHRQTKVYAPNPALERTPWKRVVPRIQEFHLREPGDVHVLSGRRTLEASIYLFTLQIGWLNSLYKCQEYVGSPRSCGALAVYFSRPSARPSEDK
jgi:hypothetical protein